MADTVEGFISGLAEHRERPIENFGTNDRAELRWDENGVRYRIILRREGGGGRHLDPNAPEGRRRRQGQPRAAATRGLARARVARAPGGGVKRQPRPAQRHAHERRGNADIGIAGSLTLAATARCGSRSARMRFRSARSTISRAARASIRTGCSSTCRRRRRTGSRGTAGSCAWSASDARTLVLTRSTARRYVHARKDPTVSRRSSRRARASRMCMSRRRRCERSVLRPRRMGRCRQPSRQAAADADRGRH